MLEKLLISRIAKFIYDDRDISSASIEDIKKLLGNLNDVGPRLDIDTIRDEELAELAKLIKKFGTVGTILKIDKFIKDFKFRRFCDDVDYYTRVDMNLMLEAAKTLREFAEKICRSNIIRILYKSFCDYINDTFNEERFLKDIIEPYFYDIELLGEKRFKEYTGEQISLFEGKTTKKRSSNRYKKTKKAKCNENSMLISCIRRMELESSFQSFIRKNASREDFENFIFSIVTLLNSKNDENYHIVGDIIKFLSSIDFEKIDTTETDNLQMVISPIIPH